VCQNDNGFVSSEEQMCRFDTRVYVTVNPLFTIS
jgi:hypothetical protein